MKTNHAAIHLTGTMELANGKTITLSAGYLTGEWSDGEPADVHVEHALDLLERLGLSSFGLTRTTWVEMGNEHSNSGHWEIV